MEAQLVFLVVLVASFEMQVVTAACPPTSGKLTSLQSMLQDIYTSLFQLMITYPTLHY